MTPEGQTTRHRILLVDDDPSLLELYRQIFAQLPSSPEILTANSGSRALAMLEAERFRLLICDLKMPKMDGLQVLSIVRRKYPELRTVALTAIPDEEFRSRVYSLGVDLFWHKPSTQQETEMFLECLESLLGQEVDNGFRGVQSKSLVDIVQLECLSQSSSVLRIANGSLSGKIWIQDGEVVDAEAGELAAEAAFLKILSWRAGTFETLPADPARQRAIFKSYNGLLLESAQAMDEARGEAANNGHTNGAPAAPLSPFAQMSQIEGVEFVLALKDGESGHEVARGLENPERMAAWTRQSLQHFHTLGDQLGAGRLEQIEGLGPQRNVTVAPRDAGLCVGWVHTVKPGEMRDRMKKALEVWDC